MTEAKDTIKRILDEANKQASDFASITEGNFKPADIDAIYDKAHEKIYQAGMKEVADWVKMTEQTAKKQALAELIFNKANLLSDEADNLARVIIQAGYLSPEEVAELLAHARDGYVKLWNGKNCPYKNTELCGR